MRARFITDTASVNVNPEQVEGSISVKSGSMSGQVNVKSIIPITEHDKLSNRNLPNQHPISAITDLQEILNKLWTYTYEQGIASATWKIQHNLGRHPSVVVVDSANSVIEPDVEYIDDNNIIVRFVGAMTGTAYLN